MNINRRNFLFGSTAAVAMTGHSTEKTGLRPMKEGEKLRIGCIGYGIQMRTALIPQLFGKLKADGTEKLAEIVAVCDCDKARAAAGAKHVNDHYKSDKCRAVADFRDILRDESIDASASRPPTTGTPTWPSRP